MKCKTCEEQLEFAQGTPKVSCENCGTGNKVIKSNPHAVAAFALTGIIFYIPANFFPFMTVDFFGKQTTSTIWEGVVIMAESGDWFIALIVFLASILIPFIKLAVLFYLAATAKNGQHRKFKTRLYHMIEAIGRWSMLDIYLLAVLVAVMKFGAWANAKPELGALMFLFVVIFTMLASASFDPAVIWKDQNEESKS